MVGDEQIGSVGSPETQVLFSFEKLLSNLNPHKAAGPDQIKPSHHPKKPFNPTITNPKTSLPKVARLGNLTTNLEGC